jgi:23S rRNA pseudouridine1911/1915/1917 synthase
MQKRWRVKRGDPRTVGEIVLAAGGDASAVDEGRVFVGRRRARSAEETVVTGDVVSIARPVEIVPTVDVLYSDDDVLAVDKPAGIPTIPDQSGASHSLLALAARAARLPEGELHPTSRLDRDVSGVVLFARSKRGRDELAAARAEGRYERRYVALAARPPDPERGTWNAPVARAADPRRRRVARPSEAAALPASTRFACVASAGAGTAMLAASPLTGRTHQIRVHASHAGAPLLGDRAYGGPARVTLPTGEVLSVPRIALHAAKVSLPRVTVASPVPADLARLWERLGGGAEAWDIAVSCPLG